jgi:hypothetical protein
MFNLPTALFRLRDVPVLLRGDPVAIRQWLPSVDRLRLAVNLVVVVAGTAAFGAAVGLWRSPLQSLYTGLKFPLIILVTTFGNALLNGMMAPLLGVNISFRQCFMAVLLSWTIAAAILGAFSPLMFFLLWNTPAASSGGAGAGYPLLLLTLVFSIAFAGIASNVRLLRLLQGLGKDRAAGTRTLVAWLAGNLLLGSQLSCIKHLFT